MDHERLAQSAGKLDKDAIKSAKSMERQAKEESRIEKRFAPFKELQTRNQAVFDRANAIIESQPKETLHGYEEESVCVIIGDVAGNAQHPIIAQVTRWGKDAGYGFQQNAQFEFFRAKKLSFAQERGNNPGGDYRLQRALAMDTEKLEGRDEATYTFGEASDDIAKEANRHISGRAFSPFMAGDRAAAEQSISRRLDDLELTMNMIEEAARNPELNPVLAKALESSAS